MEDVKIRLLWLILFAAAAVRCAADTAWVVHPGSSATKRTLLQICRSGQPCRLQADNCQKAGYPALWVYDRQGEVFAAINNNGLALIQMEGDPNRDPNPELTSETHTASRLLVMIADRCGDARSAVAAVRASVDSGKFSGGCIYLIADAREAHVVECSPKHFSSWQLPHSFCVYTNSWKLPGMDDASTADAERAKTLSQREWVVRHALRNAMLRGGGIAPEEACAVSRLDIADAQKLAAQKSKTPPPVTAAVGDDSAGGAVLFEIDDKYPMLSCAYLALGHPRRTIYLPLPLGTAEEILADGAFLAAAANAKYSPELEHSFFVNCAKARAAAKERLDHGDAAGAKKLLVDMVKQNLAALAAPAGGK